MDLEIGIIPSVNKLNIIGRSGGVCIKIKSDEVKEVLHLSDNRKLCYKQCETAFSNPNGYVNEKALDWICSMVSYARQCFNDSNPIPNLNPNPNADPNPIYNPIYNPNPNPNHSYCFNGSNTDISNDSGNNSTNPNPNPNRSNSSNSNASDSYRITDSANPNLNPNGEFDLLELYCGNGNHSVAIAGFVSKLVAVELNTTLCLAAQG
jgi:hypothetical protein